MDQSQGNDAGARLLQRRLRRIIRHAGGLHGQQTGHNLEIVLNTVVDFAGQFRLCIKRRRQFRGPAVDDFGMFSSSGVQAFGGAWRRSFS